MAKRCKKGVVQSGPRKGRCKKVIRRKKGACPKGRVQSGPRKGLCRKVRRRRKR